jgi:hypothetical protein
VRVGLIDHLLDFRTDLKLYKYSIRPGDFTQQLLAGQLNIGIT